MWNNGYGFTVVSGLGITAHSLLAYGAREMVFNVPQARQLGREFDAAILGVTDAVGRIA